MNKDEEMVQMQDEVPEEEALIEPENPHVDFEDKWKRALADLDNMRKRSDRECENLRKYSSELLILDILRSMEDMERALEMSKVKKQDLVKGFTMIMKDMKATLKKHGVEVIECVGERFDPNLHEAVMQECTDCEEMDEHIIEELQRGYRLHDRVIRHAKVKVGRYSK